jgi:hypothetical protein
MSRIERVALTLGVLGLLAVGGCTTKIGATYDPFVLFPATAQWTWDEAMNSMPSDPSMAKLNIEAIVRETIVASLAERGYTLAPDGGTADFRAYYQLGLGQIVNLDSVESFASLSLTFVDTETNRSAWVGFITTRADIAIPDAERRELLRKRLDKMLKDFPPSQPK